MFWVNCLMSMVSMAWVVMLLKPMKDLWKDKWRSDKSGGWEMTKPGRFTLLFCLGLWAVTHKRFAVYFYCVIYDCSYTFIIHRLASIKWQWLHSLSAVMGWSRNIEGTSKVMNACWNFICVQWICKTCSKCYLRGAVQF